MKPQRKYLSIISGIAPMGAVGLSLLLGSTLSAMLPSGLPMRSVRSPNRTSPKDWPPFARRFSQWLAPALPANHSDPNIQLVWGNRWFNGGWNRGRGWRRPWGNWRNFSAPWNNFWRNW